MPTVHVPINFFNKLMGQTFTNEQLDEVCFNFGIEFEFEPKTEETEASYSFEVASNRYDLLSAEGIARNLAIYMGIKNFVDFNVLNKAQQREQIIVKSENTDKIRPFVVGCILRDFKFEADNYKSFIDAQDHLHKNLGRRRTLVSMGTHDYDTIKGPFTYDAIPQDQVKFKPLNQEKVLSGPEIIEFYGKDRNMKEFADIIKDSPIFPIITDSEQKVLSMPPLINGDHSKIKLDTKNILIEITATDLTKAHIALNTLVSMFSQYCEQNFTVEEVEIVYENREKHITPKLDSRIVELDVNYTNTIIGIQQDAESMVNLLKKMGVRSEVKDEKTLNVTVDGVRSDILHPCDIAEDIAIAHNYNQIVNTPIPTSTIGEQHILNKFSDLIRNELANSGYTECLNWALCSISEITDHINIKQEPLMVTIANPKTTEFQTARTTLIPGLLRTLKSNQSNKVPLSIFEIGDIVLKTDNEVGAKNQRNLSAMFTDHDNSGLELIHGLLDQIMKKMNIKNDLISGYSIKESNNPTMFPSRQADVLLKGNKIGNFGVVHPTVLDSFQWRHPVSCLELNIELLMKGYFE